MSVSAVDLDKWAARAARGDVRSVDGHTEPDARMPALGQLASLAAAVYAVVPDAVWARIRDTFNAVGLALAEHERALSDADRSRNDLASVSRERDQFDPGPEAKPRAISRRRFFGIVGAIITVMGLHVLTDGLLLRKPLEALGLGGWERNAVAFSVAVSIAAVAYFAATVAAEAMARGRRLQSVLALGLPMAFLIAMISVFAAIRGMVLQGDVSRAQAGTEQATSRFQDLIVGSDQSGLVQLPLGLTIALFASLMLATVILTLIKFVGTNPREDWASQLDKAVDSASQAVDSRQASVQKAIGALLNARAQVEALPAAVMGEGLRMQAIANGHGWNYLRELSRKVPVEFAQVVRDMPEPAHELPDWTDSVLTAIEPARQAAVEMLEAALRNRGPADQGHGGAVDDNPVARA